MKLVIPITNLKKSYEKVEKLKLYVMFNYESSSVQKAFDSSLHPRDENGRFTDKGVMELSEKERQELLDYLENEEYELFNGVKVSKRKIRAVKSGRYAKEIEMCKVLVENGFDTYLLDENYTKGKKADTFFKRENKRDFLELKDTENDVVRQYNRSVAQAKNCFISVRGFISPSKMKALKNAISNNSDADEVYLYIESKNDFVKLK